MNVESTTFLDSSSQIVRYKTQILSRIISCYPEDQILSCAHSQPIFYPGYSRGWVPRGCAFECHSLVLVDCLVSWCYEETWWNLNWQKKTELSSLRDSDYTQIVDPQRTNSAGPVKHTTPQLHCSIRTVHFLAVFSSNFVPILTSEKIPKSFNNK